MSEFESTWWKVRLPEAWAAEPDESHVAITRSSGTGALHVSCVKKDKGRVTSHDLHDWASERGHADVPWDDAAFGRLSGVGRKRNDGSTTWHEWFLKRGRFLFFATYNCPVGSEVEELGEVARILSSIELKSSGA